ncbi:DUF1127 domain-containing protein [Roseibium sp. SCP14]|uniref:DUF1127 domain-containing protein n=1 Tax=Roseibium sp. SCP14 TaxID=3141375 RepID=UPI0033357E7C
MMSTMETILQHSVPQLRGPRHVLKLLWRHLQSWLQVSHTRRQLRDLTNAELEDLNLTREAAQEEARRPFWDTKLTHRSWI